MKLVWPMLMLIGALLPGCSIEDITDLDVTVTGTVEVADHMLIIHHKNDGLMGPKR